MLKWFIVSAAFHYLYVRRVLMRLPNQSTLKGQYTSRNEKLGSEKKCVGFSSTL